MQNPVESIVLLTEDYFYRERDVEEFVKLEKVFKALLEATQMRIKVQQKEDLDFENKVDPNEGSQVGHNILWDKFWEPFRKAKDLANLDDCYGRGSYQAFCGSESQKPGTHGF